jgi:nucleoside-diphosphate-sugar epimerase
MRFAAIYGPGRLLRHSAVAAGEPIVGDPDKWLNLIHVEDGAHAILAAGARANPAGIYNICDGSPVRRRDFYTRMAEMLNAPPPRFVLPPADARLPAHEAANRRVNNRRMREQLLAEVRHPNYELGLAAVIAERPLA